MQNAQQAQQPAPMTKEWALNIFDLMHARFQDTPEGHYHIQRARNLFEGVGVIAPTPDATAAEHAAAGEGGTVCTFPTQHPTGSK